LYGASNILLKRESFRVRETSQNESQEVWRASSYVRTLYSHKGYCNENGNTHRTKLEITLRYLTSGDSFRTLHHLYRVSAPFWDECATTFSNDNSFLFLFV
jgi:hypothetical protein